MTELGVLNYPQLYRQAVIEDTNLLYIYVYVIIYLYIYIYIYIETFKLQVQNKVPHYTMHIGAKCKRTHASVGVHVLNGKHAHSQV